MKRNLFHAALAAVFALCCMPSFSQTIPDPATPDATYKFAEKDGQELFLDDYLPHGASENALDVQSKPTIIFVFGGGFKGILFQQDQPLHKRSQSTAGKSFYLLHRLLYLLQRGALQIRRLAAL